MHVASQQVKLGTPTPRGSQRAQPSVSACCAVHNVQCRTSKQAGWVLSSCPITASAGLVPACCWFPACPACIVSSNWQAVVLVLLNRRNAHCTPVYHCCVRAPCAARGSLIRISGRLLYPLPASIPGWQGHRREAAAHRRGAAGRAGGANVDKAQPSAEAETEAAAAAGDNLDLSVQTPQIQQLAAHLWLPSDAVYS